MMDPEKCVKCQYPFDVTNKKFYCCDTSKKYCIVCRENACPDCSQRTINKQVKTLKCSECTSSSSNLIYQPICGSYFCCKCVAPYRTKNDLAKFPKKHIQLPCGHQLEKSTAQKFLSNACSFCGCNFNKIIDYELLNDQKCCLYCFQDHQEELEGMVMICMICDKAIKNFSDVGAMENDFLLCSTCVVMSNMNSKEIQYAKALEQQYQEAKKLNISYLQKTQKSTPSVEVDNTSRKDNQSISKNKQDPVIQNPENSEEFKINPDFCKEKDRGSRIKIVSEFPEKQILSKNKSKVRKNFSMETLVQALKLTLNRNKEQTVDCQGCNFQITKNTAFWIQKNNQQKQKSGYYCRCCYTPLRKAEHLAFTSKNQNISIKQSRERIKSNEKLGDLYSKIKGRKPQQTFDSDRTVKNTVLKPKIIKIQPKKKQQCQRCHQLFESLINTVKKEKICFRCYEKRRKT